MFRMQKILVATDFSEPAHRALAYALELAQRVGAEVVLVHAYQIPVYGFPDGAYIPAADMASQLGSAAQEMLDRTVNEHANRGVKLTGILRQGVPRREVNAVAREMGADLIVVGTHGRRGVTRALLGSVAENIIRQAEIPVLAIREPVPEH